MSEQIEYDGFESSEFADNPEPRVPCMLLLDTSGSMTGQPIDELNEGLITLKDTLAADSLACAQVDVCQLCPLLGKGSVPREAILSRKLLPK